MKTCSLVHMHRTRVMRKAFTETRFTIYGSLVKDCTSPPWPLGESQKGLDCVDQDAASSASPLRENHSLVMWTAPDIGGSSRLHANICKTCARRRCMMCPPCRQSSSRFTGCYKYLNRKDELVVRRIRPSLLSKKAFQAELFSDSSFECPPWVLSLLMACFTKKKTHDAWHPFSFRFDLNRPVTWLVLSTASSSQRPQAATKSRLARLRDLGRIRHAWSATRVQTARCWLCAQDQLSTRSVSLFLSRRSARWLCRLPHVRHPFGLTRSCLVQLQENKGSRSPRLVALARHGAREKLRRATGPKVTLHLAPSSLCGTMVYGTVRALHFFFCGCQSSLFSTETLL